MRWCDAMLGAVGAGDLGERFSDRDPAHAGRDSSEFVREVLALPAMKPWRLANLDVNIIAEAPRLMDHKPAMRARLAELFHLPLGRVGLKARTNEGLDAVGECRAIQRPGRWCCWCWYDPQAVAGKKHPGGDRRGAGSVRDRCGGRGPIWTAASAATAKM